MWVLVAGVVLWWAAHLFKRVAPGPRAAMGAFGRPVVAVVIVGSVVLMAAGYDSASVPAWWGRHPASGVVGNLLAAAAFYLMVASALKTRAVGVVRHPQLAAMKAWAAGHLLVAGHLAGLILFGGLLAWAAVQVAIVNKQDGKPALRRPASGAGKEILAVAIAAAAYGAAGYAHGYLGRSVFG